MAYCALHAVGACFAAQQAKGHTRETNFGSVRKAKAFDIWNNFVKQPSAQQLETLWPSLIL